MMDLRVLAFFRSVAETGSITEASRRHLVSQPVGSRMIMALERSLDVRLFRRTSRGMQLTPEGQRFRRLAVDLLVRAEGAEAVMRAGAGRTPMIAVACPETTATFSVAPFLAETGAPIVDIRPFRPAAVYAALLDGVDLAINSMRPPSQYMAVRVIDVPILVQSPASATPASGSRPIELADLGGERLILPGFGSAVEREVREAALRADVGVDLSQLTGTGTIAQALSAAGRGVALVTEPAQFGLRGAPLVVDAVPLTIPLFAAWEKDHYASGHIRDLVARFVAWMAQHYGEVGLPGRGDGT